nr:formate/nitrite transporter family protein [Haladaptatus halobius]
MSLLSYLLQSVNGVNGRITMAYVIGFMLALGPFDHVIDTTLHIVFGMLFGAGIGYGALATTVAVVTAGNLVGGDRFGHVHSRRPGTGCAAVRRVTPDETRRAIHGSPKKYLPCPLSKVESSVVKGIRISYSTSAASNTSSGWRIS